MTAYYRKTKDKKYRMVLFIDGAICDGGKYDTKKDCMRRAKELGITNLKKWEQ